ncbi:hypothetical protein BXZ70DRAFT_903330 [Cristinia sonorae]|uniref:Uncharacterized protein n=1 Tax=Cristinia sonorae TaxID=1940300 RepID=A0A8K0V002_9AGAR|nr:hypothetical protein BXZ70DRAFT_903330 [Cristinia sonorae]
MADREEVTAALNAPHPPAQNAIDAFVTVEERIKEEILKSYNHWKKHDEEMWKHPQLTNVTTQLVSFNVTQDLVEVRAAQVTYGTIIFGKIRIPSLDDPAGFVHVRIHIPVGTNHPLYHSILTDEGNTDENGNSTGTWKPRAIQPNDKPLEYFAE